LILTEERQKITLGRICMKDYNSHNAPHCTVATPTIPEQCLWGIRLSEKSLSGNKFKASLWQWDIYRKHLWHYFQWHL